MSQIKIQDLLPLLRPGFVAMDKNGNWGWFKEKPRVDVCHNDWFANIGKPYVCLAIDAFDIARFDGDWKDSLMECGQKR